MGLESSFNYIDDLNTANPNGDPDQLAEADNHLRGIKSSIKGSFPNLGATAVTKTAAEINDLVDKSTAQTITGVKTFSSTIAGSVSGSAATWATARNIVVSGDVSGTTSNFNGSANATLNLQIGANKVTASEIAANAVSFSSQMNSSTSSGVFVSSSGFDKIIPAGVYNLGDITASWTAGLVKVQIYAGGWIDVWTNPGGTEGPRMQVTSDGASVKIITNSGTSSYINYRRLYA